MKQEDLIKFNHAVFTPMENSKYLVVKDILGHFSVDSVISGQMLNSYLSIVKGARVFVGSIDDAPDQ